MVTIKNGREGIVHPRGALKRTEKAIEEKTLKIGFIGGSITAFEDYVSWTEPVINWFTNTYKDCRIFSVNSGIGSTKSEYGVFRAMEDLKECDLVFVEYAVNDNGDTTDYRMRTREGLVRKLMEHSDVALVYTFCQEMYDDMTRGIVPRSIVELEEIADNYAIPTVWMGLKALRKNMEGLVRWEEWLPDGTHPKEVGSRIYASAVIDYLENELFTGNSVSQVKAEPLYPDNWETAEILDFDKVNFKSPWSVRNNRSNMGSVNPGQVLYTSAIGAELEIEFEGTGLFMVMMFGRLAGEFDYSVDGGEMKPINPVLGRDEWMGKTDWYRGISIADKLPYGKHILRMVTRHADGVAFPGTRILIKMIGVVK